MYSRQVGYGGQEVSKVIKVVVVRVLFVDAACGGDQVDVIGNVQPGE